MSYRTARGFNHLDMYLLNHTKREEMDRKPRAKVDYTAGLSSNKSVSNCEMLLQLPLSLLALVWAALSYGYKGWSE